MAMIASRRGRRFRSTMTYALLLFVAVAIIFPVIWGVSSSLKPEDDIRAYPPLWIPETVTPLHYQFVLRHTMMLRFFLNSLIICSIAVFSSLLVGSLAAFALRFSFPGRDGMLAIMLGIMLLGGGGLVGLVPLYMAFQRLHLLDTYTVLIILYGGWAVPGTIFFMSGFFKQVPHEIEDAATIDGCSRFQLFVRIFVPLSKPGLVALSTINFIAAWNEFLAALTFIHKPEMRTVPVGVYSFLNQYIGTQFGPLLASAVLSAIPVLIIFVFLQRYLITGLLQGAIKG